MFTRSVQTTAASNPTQGIQGGPIAIKGVNDDSQRLKVYGEQLVCIAGDNSGSMSGAKAGEATAAIAACMRTLTDPVNKDGFRVSFVSYGSSARLESSAVEPGSLGAHLDGSGGGTALAPALRAIGREIDGYAYRPGRVRQAPVVIVFSDGCLADTAAAIAEAAALKAKGAMLITIGFGSDVDAGALQSIASAPDHYAFADVGQLQTLFARVGKTLSQSMVKTGLMP